MAKAKSAGILLYSENPDRPGAFAFLIGHPGGPFFKKKDTGHWTIPKGEIDPEEDVFLAACREFEEETGMELETRNDPVALGDIKQKGGKEVRAWGLPGSYRDPQPCKSNTFPLEWPPKSGRTLQVPELDALMWADYDTASEKLKAAQLPFLQRLSEHLKEHR